MERVLGMKWITVGYGDSIQKPSNTILEKEGRRKGVGEFNRGDIGGIAPNTLLRYY
jgi:hypothetical protein